MIKATIKKDKNGLLQMDLSCKKTNGIEVLYLIEHLIMAMEENTGYNFRKIIKCIKETRKQALKAQIEYDKLNNTDK